DLKARSAVFGGADSPAGRPGEAFQITPSLTTPITVTGGGPAGRPGDSLRLLLSPRDGDVTFAPLANAGAGRFSFRRSSPAPVTFSGIERTNLGLQASALPTGNGSYVISAQARVGAAAAGG